MANEKLTQQELRVLQSMAGDDKYVWGAAVGQAVESLVGSGYAHRELFHAHITPTEKGWRALLDHAREEASRQGAAFYVMSEPERDPIKAIAFAQMIDDHFDLRAFLDAWMEGALAEWPEFKKFCEQQT